MIIVFKPQATEEDIDHVTDRLRELGLKSQISQGEERTIIGVIGDERLLDNQPLSVFPGVESVTPIMAPWKLVSREFQKHDTVIDVDDFFECPQKSSVFLGLTDRHANHGAANVTNNHPFLQQLIEDVMPIPTGIKI